MSEEKNTEEKRKCPLSPTDWVMFLSDKINTKETSQSAFITMIITIVLALLVVMAGSIYAFMNMNTELALMVSSSLIKFWSFILCAILGLIIFLIFIPEITKKKVKPLKEILEDIIDGENDSNKIRERWKEIDTMFEKKRNGKKHAFSTRTWLFIRLIIGLIFVALLIALVMLVASLLIKFVLLISFIPIFFAVVTIFRNKLEKNEKAVVDQRFGDALIGIISGLVASYLMWVLLIFGETSLSLPLLFFLIYAVSLVLVVSLLLVYSLIIVWVFFTRN